MFFYKFKNKILISNLEYNFEKINESEALNNKDLVYALHKLNPLKSRKTFSVSHPSLLFLKEENVNLLSQNDFDKNISHWILEKINNRQLISINTDYPNWEDILNYNLPNKWRINIVGLGDVGGTLLIGLRLLGKDIISSIGIYSENMNTLKRWDYEVNQIAYPFDYNNYPDVSILGEKDIFNCDMFIFCASKSVPPLDTNVKDVRMVQFEENSKIIKTYAKKARENKFKGIFAVVSDPVDPLCKVAFLESNKDSYENLDFNGLSSDQIRGYGLGVMNARALYYSKQNPETIHYGKEGRAFGPHGNGLIIANSIKDYNEELSTYLTEKALSSNLEVRTTGFKPYIAPALSSGALSIISTITGKWHYSSIYMGGVYMGCTNRLNVSGSEIEMLNLPNALINKIKSTYDALSCIK